MRDAWRWEPQDWLDIQGFLWIANDKAVMSPVDIDEAADKSERLEKPMSISSVNLILYGPPGTGKTFSTAAEAVRLCGEIVPENRAELMTAYQRLLAAGRIEFVTFHQSMSYEEFVEGLRPETQGAENQGLDVDDLDTAGFRLKIEDGIFKRICERARLDPGANSDDRRLDRSRPIFKIALGRRLQEEEQIKEALDANEIRHGWAEEIDWTDEQFEDWAEIKAELERQIGKEVSSHAGELVCTFSFRSDMQVGDYVVVSDGRDRMRAFGTITSNYFFEADAERHPHRRAIEWLWRDDRGTERARFYPNGFRQHTVYKLTDALVDWDGLECIIFGVDRSIPAESARPYVLIIDEINRANISKVFGELITLLEPDKRLRTDNEIRLTLSYSKRLFGVPANLHVLGTMNTADRSVALLDTALRRRFTFREMMPDASVLTKAAHSCGIDLPRLLSTINERIEYLYDREHQIGHAYFSSCDSRSAVDEVMRHKVIPLLAEYFFEDWAKIAAVLGDLESHEGPITGGFLKRSILKRPPGLEDGDAVPRFRWEVRSEVEGFDYGKLAGI
ncbi:MAG: AAA family ATPase [Parvibaculaceae bacterium]|nr:AAA family ATPase [Parvibaculaceae bacterium]